GAMALLIGGSLAAGHAGLAASRRAPRRKIVFQLVERRAAAHQADKPGVVDLRAVIDAGKPTTREDHEAIPYRERVLDIVGLQHHAQPAGASPENMAKHDCRFID